MRPTRVRSILQTPLWHCFIQGIYYLYAHNTVVTKNEAVFHLCRCSQQRRIQFGKSHFENESVVDSRSQHQFAPRKCNPSRTKQRSKSPRELVNAKEGLPSLFPSFALGDSIQRGGIEYPGKWVSSPPPPFPSICRVEKGWERGKSGFYRASEAGGVWSGCLRGPPMLGRALRTSVLCKGGRPKVYVRTELSSALPKFGRSEISVSSEPLIINLCYLLFYT